MSGRPGDDRLAGLRLFVLAVAGRREPGTASVTTTISATPPPSGRGDAAYGSPSLPLLGSPSRLKGFLDGFYHLSRRKRRPQQEVRGAGFRRPLRLRFFGCFPLLCPPAQPQGLPGKPRPTAPGLGVRRRGRRIESPSTHATTTRPTEQLAPPRIRCLAMPSRIADRRRGTRQRRRAVAGRRRRRRWWRVVAAAAVEAAVEAGRRWRWRWRWRWGWWWRGRRRWWRWRWRWGGGGGAVVGRVPGPAGDVPRSPVGLAGAACRSPVSPHPGPRSNCLPTRSFAGAESNVVPVPVGEA